MASVRRLSTVLSFPLGWASKARSAAQGQGKGGPWPLDGAAVASAEGRTSPPGKATAKRERRQALFCPAVRPALVALRGGQGGGDFGRPSRARII